MGPRDRFHLDPLLELRQQIKRRREEQLADALCELDRREVALGGARDQLAEARGQLAGERRALTRVDSPVSAGALGQHGRFIARVEGRAARRRAAVAEAVEARSEATRAVEAAREQLAAAEADLELVQRQRGRWDRARREAEDRRAEAELEEIAAAMMAAEPD